MALAPNPHFQRENSFLRGAKSKIKGMERATNRMRRDMMVRQTTTQTNDTEWQMTERCTAAIDL